MSTRAPALGADAAAALTTLRRDLHQHPELAFAERRTAAVVADHLRGLGVTVTTEVGGTGVVGVIGDGSGPVIGLRADMDALPITEAIDRPHTSAVPGVMHACGHDGHVAMLLGAAEILSTTADLPGTVVLVCQPAEEGAAGAQAMLDDGLLDRFGIEEIYGLHNIPGMAAGSFATRPGAQLASFDRLEITLRTGGGHAATPQLTGDVVVAGAYLVTELQAIVARRVDPFVPAAISIASFQAGTTDNVLPTEAVLRGTVRTLDADTQQRITEQVRAVCDAVAAAHGVTVSLDYRNLYPRTVNDAACAQRAAAAARVVADPDRVDANCTGILAAEDFSFFLQQIPGAYVFIGNGPVTDISGPVHNPTYDFNDDIIADGAAFLATVARMAIEDRRRSR